MGYCASSAPASFSRGRGGGSRLDALLLRGERAGGRRGLWFHGFAAGGGVQAFALNGPQPGDLLPGAPDGHGVSNLAGALLKLQVEAFAVRLVDGLREFFIGQGAGIGCRRGGHG